MKECSYSISVLSTTANTQPHAAFSALTHGLLNEWTYLSQIQPNISDLLLPLDDVLRTDLLPALTGHPRYNDLEFALFIYWPG